MDKFSPKVVTIVIVGCVIVVTVAYVVYIAASWQAFQHERQTRIKKVDDLLSRIPTRKDGGDDNAGPASGGAGNDSRPVPSPLIDPS